MQNLKNQLHNLNKKEWLFETAYDMQKEYLEFNIKHLDKEIKELER